MNGIIKKINARRILDSRGWPTVEVEISSENFTEIARVPSGASTGIHEALELRDGKGKFFMGKDISKALKNIDEIIAPKIIGKSCFEQKKLDEIMLKLDGTENKNKLGANAILAVSLAISRLSAKEKNIPLFERFGEIYEENFGKLLNKNILPTPMVNVINGGEHANSNLAIQEFMLMPFGKDFAESLAMASDMFHILQKKLKSLNISTAVGDEGGVALFLDKNFPDTEAVFSLLDEVVETCGFTGKVKYAIDAAASEFYKDGKYLIDGKSLNSEELTSFYEKLVSNFSLISIEDSHDEDDFEGWKFITKKMGDKIMLVGDDLFVTNKKRIQMGIDGDFANSVLIKINQIGSIFETLEAINLAYQNGMKCIISHRSGETEDTSIADLAVGLGTGFIKTGSMSRTERIAKYNQLLRIEEKLRK